MIIHANPRRVAALLFRRVGDSLLATPALRAVKTTFPQSHLAVLAEPQTARVFAHNPWIDELITIPAAPSVFRLTRLLHRSGPWDVALDFLSDPRSALACRCSGASRRIGFSGRGRRWAYTNAVPRQDTSHPVYSATHKLKLAAAIGCLNLDCQTDFFLTDADHAFADQVWALRGWTSETTVAAFFIHSRRTYKRWPLEYFTALFKRVQSETNLIPLLLATPGDDDSIAHVAAACHLSDNQIVSLTDLGHLGAVLSKCRVLIGNDGGPKHLAVALQVPTVTIFQSDHPAYWTPPDSDRHIALSGMTTSPIESPRWTSAVTPKTVFEAIASLLNLTQP